MFNRAGFVFAVCLLLSFIATAQDHKIEVSLSGGDAISSSTDGEGVSHTATQSLAVIGTARLRFSKRSAVEINYGHSKDSQKYETGTLSYRIPTTVTEFTGDYVYSFMQSAKLHPFFLAGAGILVFNPTSSFINDILTPVGDVRQTRAAFLYGFGADYRITSRFSARVQYRGFFYSSPDFSVPALFTGGHAHMAEPSVGIVFGF